MVAPDDSRIARCGFCKLEGDVVDEFFCQRYEIVMGRRSKSTRLDVVLGMGIMLLVHSSHLGC